MEVTLAKRIALLSWRLHRVTRFETEAIAISQGQIEEDIHRKAMLLRSLRESSYGSTHPEDVRLEARHNRKTHNALSRLRSLAPGKIMKGEDATSVVWSVLGTAEKAMGEEIEVEGLHLPGVPEDAFIEELPAMKAEDVWGCVESIARTAGEDAEELLATATEAARSDAVSTKYKAEEVEAEIDVMRRERILPDEKTLEKVSRYEAHLSRQLYHALHELENLQKHRTTGAGVPLFRLDTQGIAED
jgi:hypothetical protein